MNKYKYKYYIIIYTYWLLAINNVGLTFWKIKFQTPARRKLQAPIQTLINVEYSNLNLYLSKMFHVRDLFNLLCWMGTKQLNFSTIFKSTYTNRYFIIYYYNLYFILYNLCAKVMLTDHRLKWFNNRIFHGLLIEKYYML